MHDDIRKLSPGNFDQILRREDQLNAETPAGNNDGVKIGGRFMDKCRKLLLHADGGTAAPDITGDGIDIFDMDQFNILLTGSLGSGL